MKQNHSVTIFWLSVVAVAVIAYMLVSAQSITRASYLKNEGIIISADGCEDIGPIAVDSIRQDDSRWGMTIMCDDLNVRICEYGSQLCCTASVFRLFNIYKTPDELYSMFHANSLYSDDGSDVFCDFRPEYMQYKYALTYESPAINSMSVFKSKDIISLLKKGSPVLVRTSNPSVSRFWVVIIGIKDGEFIIMDPLSDEYGLLSDYNNKVYQMIYFTE